MTGGIHSDFSIFLQGAMLSLLWCAIGLAVWWVMFRAPLGRRNFRATADIRAPAEKIWAALFHDPSPAGGWSGALEIERQGFEGAPPQRHRAFIRHGGGGPFRESVWRVLRLTPNACYEAEQCRLDGADVAPADAVTTRWRLTPHGDVVRVEQSTRRRAQGIFGHLYAPGSHTRFLEHLRAHCEGAEGRAHSAIVSRRANILMAALAFGVVVAIYAAGNPELWEIAAFVGFFLQFAIWLHEYGHLVAMRWFGHAEATFVMVPLLGGAAINARRAQTRFEEAIVALMGPALSGFIILALTPVAPWGLKVLTSGWDFAGSDWSNPETVKTVVGLCAITFLAMSIPINLYNLVPIGLLDGGRIVHAMARSRLSHALLVTVIFAALAFALAGSAGPRDVGAAVAFVAFVWIADLFMTEKSGDVLAPMNRLEAFTTVALLVVTLTIYVDAARTLTPSFVAALQIGVEGPAAQKPEGL